MFDSDIPVIDIEEMSFGKGRFASGIVLAVSSCLFIGCSFIVKKIGLIRLANKGELRAGAGGYGYLKDWIWWSGLVLMAIGEACNFAAYAFAPASLITPLGALSVLITALLASKFLNESLNIFAKLGCINAILGSTVLVIHAPKEGEIKNLDELESMLYEQSFIIYLSFTVIVSCILIFIYSPKYGNKYVIINILICSLIGSLSVMACKGLGISIADTIVGTSNDIKHPLFWFFLFSLIITMSIQMNYLNKALDIFDASLVTPVYYVFFTSFVLIASSILFLEWNNMSSEDIIGSLSGFFIIIISIFLINYFKDIKVDIALFHFSQKFNKDNNRPDVNYQSISTNSLPTQDNLIESFKKHTNSPALMNNYLFENNCISQVEVHSDISQRKWDQSEAKNYL